MHRLMLTSSAYRMMSAGPDLSEANARIDPENVTYWHMNPRRMEAEVVRDSALYLAGMLEEKMGGEDIDEKDGLKSRRRSLYIRTSPENRAEFLKLFDQPDPTECYMRSESIMPQQALALANSSLTMEAAKALSETFTALDDDRFIAAAFQLILGLKPSSDEAAESKRFLGTAARWSLVHALLNHNEFVTVR